MLLQSRHERWRLQLGQSFPRVVRSISERASSSCRHMALECLKRSSCQQQRRPHRVHQEETLPLSSRPTSVSMTPKRVQNGVEISMVQSGLNMSELKAMIWEFHLSFLGSNWSSTDCLHGCGLSKPADKISDCSHTRDRWPKLERFVGVKNF